MIQDRHTDTSNEPGGTNGVANEAVKSEVGETLQPVVDRGTQSQDSAGSSQIQMRGSEQLEDAEGGTKEVGNVDNQENLEESKSTSSLSTAECKDTESNERSLQNSNAGDGDSAKEGKDTKGNTNTRSAPKKPREVVYKRTRALLEVEPLQLHEDFHTFQIIFRRCVAAIIGSHNVLTTQDAFLEICALTEEYMGGLFGKLHQISQVQRRSQPSISDVALLLKFTGISLTGLEKEMQLGNSRLIDCLNCLRLNPDEEPLNELEKLMIEDPHLRTIVPSLAKRGSYVPAWMPEFPPDHTFKATPQYPTRVSDPKKLRQLIVEEGRLAEAALKRFFDSQAAVLNQIEKERFTNNDVASQKERQLENVNGHAEVVRTDYNDGDEHGDDMDDSSDLSSVAEDDPIIHDDFIMGGTQEDNSKGEEKELEHPKPRIALKLSFGRGKIRSVSATSNPAPPAASPQDVNAARFDVVAYARERLQTRDMQVSQPARTFQRQPEWSQKIVEDEFDTVKQFLTGSPHRRHRRTDYLVTWNKHRYAD